MNGSSFEKSHFLAISNIEETSWKREKLDIYSIFVELNIWE